MILWKCSLLLLLLSSWTVKGDYYDFMKHVQQQVVPYIDKSVDLNSGNTAIVQVFQYFWFKGEAIKLEEVKWNPTRMEVYIKEGPLEQGLAFVIRGQGKNISLNTRDRVTGQLGFHQAFAPVYHVASFPYLSDECEYLNPYVVTLTNGETGAEVKYDTIIEYVNPGEVTYRNNLRKALSSMIDKSVDLNSGNTSIVQMFQYYVFKGQAVMVEELKWNPTRVEVYVKEGAFEQGLAFVVRGQGNDISLYSKNLATGVILQRQAYAPTYRIASFGYIFKVGAYLDDLKLTLKNGETGEEVKYDTVIHYVKLKDQTTTVATTTTTVAPTTTTTLSPDEVSFRKNLMELIDTKVNKSIDLYSGNTSFVHVFHWQTYENQPNFVLEELENDADIYVKEGCTSQGLAFVFKGQGNNFSVRTWNYQTNKSYEIPTYLPTFHVAYIDYLNHSAYSSESFENPVFLKNQETAETSQLLIHYIRPEDQTTTAVTPTESPTEILGFPLSDIEGIIAPLISKSIDLHSGKTNVRQIMQWDKSEDGTLSFKQLMWQVTDINVFVKRNITDQGLAFVIQGTGDRFSVTLRSEKTGAETTREANLLENRVVMIPFGENGQKMFDEELRFTLENLGTGMKHTYQQIIRLTRKSFIHPP